MKLYRLFAVIIVLLLIWQFWPKQKPTQAPIVLPTPTAAVLSIQTDSSSLCHINGVLPDTNCTPGSIDPQVTQDNIFQTICSKGYSTSVRPPVAYTNKLKRQQIIDYGYLDTNLKDYEEDHLISLELGGSPTDPKNLWPEPDDSPNPKDAIENLCHHKVCSGEISLSDAQKQIATNWPTACQ